MTEDLIEWIGFNKFKSKKFNKSVWVPLRSSEDIISEGKFGFLGYKNEYFALASVMFPLEKKSDVLKLTWDSVNLDSYFQGYIEEDTYFTSDQYTHDIELNGTELILCQHYNSNENTQWYPHQDIVLTLNLLQEGDIWVSPNEGYTEVIRLTRDQIGNPVRIEIKAEHLKDYLCARNMGLYLSMYSTRDIIYNTKQELSSIEQDDENVQYKFYESEIHEGGGVPFGGSAAVLHISRDDIDKDEDLPDISDLPTDENVTSKTWTKKFDGKKLYRYTADIWKTEWLDPALKSVRIKGDEVPPSAFFIVDAEGNKENGDTLKHSGKWLWFKPNVISELTAYREGGLTWYTKDTGGVYCSPDYNVHFGVNDLGLITVYAKDIAILPSWQQQIWSGHNISPEGGVSKELLDAQVNAKPSDTQAPEEFLYQGLKELNKASKKTFDINICKDHDFIPTLMTKIHRFRATDSASLFALAKDVARVTVDSFDSSSIQTIVTPPKKVKWGSLKSIEKLLSLKLDTEEARKITAPLVGIYELRLADAHLPTSKIDEAYNLVGIDKKIPVVHQAYFMLHQCVTSIYTISEIINNWDEIDKLS